MSGRLIMVVEDADDTREIMTLGLEAAGYRVVAVADAQSALAAFKDERPDLVTLDVLLSESSGIALLQEIRTVDERVPIVMVSSWGDFRQDFNVWSSDAYVVKSVDLIKDLLATIASILK